jgi:ABC-2 type transport system ATP-binding protein
MATAALTVTDERRMAAEVVAELQGVSKSYGDTLALDAVDLSFDGGRLTAVLGPNGAGKTTAIKLLLGLTRPSAGRVRLFGADPVEPAARRRVGAMLQVSKVPETLKVREHIELFASYYPRPLPAAEVIAAAGLRGLEERLFGQALGRRAAARAVRAGAGRRSRAAVPGRAERGDGRRVAARVLGLRARPARARQGRSC